jgi:hypothetical protein
LFEQLQITESTLIELQNFQVDMINTGYKFVYSEVLVDDTVDSLMCEVAMIYIEYSHYLHKSEKYYINSLGQKLDIKKYESYRCQSN